MLVSDSRRLALIVGPLVTFLYIALRLFYQKSSLTPGLDGWVGNTLDQAGEGNFSHSSPEQAKGIPQPSSTPSTQEDSTVGLQDVSPFATHNEIFSISTPDQKFFYLRFGDRRAMNPNILPHPLVEDRWIIVAQQYKLPSDQKNLFLELFCSAKFRQDTLECTDPPAVLPIAATTGSDGGCQGKLGFISMNIGPHDARIFYGPLVPYTMYGSNSLHTCFGQWIQDLRALVPWGEDVATDDKLTSGTELQRPPPYLPIEKNWFLFWDTDGQAYLHYEVAPTRVFAKLADDGSVGPDMAPLAAPGDQRCLDRYMPKVAPNLESIHQSTNSLAITLCKRADPSCRQSESNTFIFTIFQHKTFYNFHSEYEPYVILFRQQAPFDTYGISKKPMWINGRERRGETSSQMFYIMSMSWKARGQKYHGFLDDVLFLSFGIEDEDTGAIDVTAENLLRGLGLCSEE